MTNSKLQINPKSEARNPKQILNPKFGILKFGYWKLFVICFLVLGALPSVVLALEVDFPSVQGVEVTDSMGPAQWVRYIFLMAQALVGLAIIYALVRSGVEWMTARGNEGQVKTAKDRITGALLGLIILLGSYIFLRTINPQLVNIRNPSAPQFKAGAFKFYSDVFLGGGAGSRCGSDFNCRDGLKCENNVCVESSAGKFSATNTGDCGKNADSSRCGFGNCINTLTNERVRDYNVETGECTFKIPVGEECNIVSFCYKGTCADSDSDGVKRCELQPSS